MEQYYLSSRPESVMLPSVMVPAPAGGVVGYNWPGISGYTRPLGHIKLSYGPGSLREFMPVLSLLSTVPAGDPPAGYSSLNLIFELTGIISNGQSVVLDLPLPDHLDLSALSAPNFLMQYYEPTLSQWKNYPTTLGLNRGAATLSVSFTHFSTWRVLYKADSAGTSSTASVSDAAALDAKALSTTSAGGGGCFLQL